MAAQHTFHPYRNETESIQIGDLNIENRLDRITIYGNVDLTLDKEGLTAARALKEVLDQTVAALEQADLPEHVAVAEPDTVANPFA
jgi:hypothetical protein